MKPSSSDSIVAGFWSSYLLSLLLLAAFALASLLSGCALLDDEATTRELLVAPGDSFNLREGQSARLRDSGFTITFVRRTEEGRCPVGLACFWEGEAEVALIARLGNQVDPFRVRGFFGQAEGSRLNVTRFGYRIELERLDPYPVDGQSNPPPVRLALRIEP